MKLELPPKDILPYTNDEDPLKYYFIPAVGYVYKKRLKNTLALLGKRRYGSLLEIAFGSGLLFPELSRRTEKLYGLETHENIPEVEAMLAKIGVKAELTQGSLMEMPYGDNSFDAVVAVSVYEHIPELGHAMKELRRVMKPGAHAALSFPVRNIITDSFFRAVGHNPRELHPSGHRDIIDAALRFLKIERVLLFPRFLPADLSLYCSIRCVKN